MVVWEVTREDGRIQPGPCKECKIWIAKIIWSMWVHERMRNETARLGCEKPSLCGAGVYCEVMWKGHLVLLTFQASGWELEEEDKEGRYTSGGQNKDNLLHDINSPILTCRSKGPQQTQNSELVYCVSVISLIYIFTPNFIPSFPEFNSILWNFRWRKSLHSL